jgi:hypothetical protein
MLKKVEPSEKGAENLRGWVCLEISAVCKCITGASPVRFLKNNLTY